MSCYDDAHLHMLRTALAGCCPGTSMGTSEPAVINFGNFNATLLQGDLQVAAARRQLVAVAADSAVAAVSRPPTQRRASTMLTAATAGAELAVLATPHTQMQPSSMGTATDAAAPKCSRSADLRIGYQAPAADANNDAALQLPGGELSHLHRVTEVVASSSAASAAGEQPVMGAIAEARRAPDLHIGTEGNHTDHANNNASDERTAASKRRAKSAPPKRGAATHDQVDDGDHLNKAKVAADEPARPLPQTDDFRTSKTNDRRSMRASTVARNINYADDNSDAADETPAPVPTALRTIKQPSSASGVKAAQVSQQVDPLVSYHSAVPLSATAAQPSSVTTQGFVIGGKNAALQKLTQNSSTLQPLRGVATVPPQQKFSDVDSHELFALDELSDDDAMPTSSTLRGKQIKSKSAAGTVSGTLPRLPTQKSQRSSGTTSTAGSHHVSKAAASAAASKKRAAAASPTVSPTVDEQGKWGATDRVSGITEDGTNVPLLQLHGTATMTDNPAKRTRRLATATGAAPPRQAAVASSGASLMQKELVRAAHPHRVSTTDYGEFEPAAVDVSPRNIATKQHKAPLTASARSSGSKNAKRQTPTLHRQHVLTTVHARQGINVDHKAPDHDMEPVIDGGDRNVDGERDDGKRMNSPARALALFDTSDKFGELDGETSHFRRGVDLAAAVRVTTHDNENADNDADNDFGLDDNVDVAIDADPAGHLLKFGLGDFDNDKDKKPKHCIAAENSKPMGARKFAAAASAINAAGPPKDMVFTTPRPSRDESLKNFTAVGNTGMLRKARGGGDLATALMTAVTRLGELASAAPHDSSLYKIAKTLLQQAGPAIAAERAEVESRLKTAAKAMLARITAEAEALALSTRGDAANDGALLDVSERAAKIALRARAVIAATERSRAAGSSAINSFRAALNAAVAARATSDAAMRDDIAQLRAKTIANIKAGAADIRAKLAGCKTPASGGGSRSLVGGRGSDTYQARYAATAHRRIDDDSAAGSPMDEDLQGLVDLIQRNVG